MNIAFLFLGLVSGLFAGLLAFVITYDEYSRHYTDRRRTLRLALEAAAFAFFVFLALFLGAITAHYVREHRARRPFK